jgi:RHS repeat-associated protein
VPYTVTHAGGTSTVVVNQRVNGGQWNLLGTYTFDGGTGYTVEMSDSPSGTVAADAIYIAPAGGPSADAFIWTPAIASSGIYQVYARWPASSANTGAAEYAVTHGGGTANVTLNQKQNGGAWVPLGSWSFAPSAGHKVTLAAAAEGATIADAMLFVAAGAQPANLLYVHADHLGSPQKLTDASQATVWDGVFDPFGEEIAVTGLAAMPMRFPGQYTDEETGFRYNYFRDYAPTLGRYVQSDPIGLRGGLNGYHYVTGNPLGRIDFFGLTEEDVSSVLGQVIDEFDDISPRGEISYDWEPLFGGLAEAYTELGSADIVLPHSWAEYDCFTRKQWERLFAILFHESMHSTDDFWTRLLQPDDGIGSHHDSIYERQEYELNEDNHHPDGPMWGTPRDGKVDMDALYDEYRRRTPACQCQGG